MRYLQGLWAILIICSSLAALGTMLVLPDGGIRPFVVAWFLFVCPGWAMVRLLSLNEFMAKLMLALALSFSIDGLVAGAYLYADRWAPREIMFTLTMFSIGLVIIERTHIHIFLYRHSAFIRSIAALLTHPVIIGTATTDTSFPSPTKKEEADLIDEMPTVQLARATLTPTPASADVEELPTLHMAIPTNDIEDRPTSHLVVPTNDIEDRPTSHLAIPPDTAIEEHPTVQIAIPSVAAIEDRPTSHLETQHTNKNILQPQLPEEEAEQKQFDTTLPDDIDIEQKSTMMLQAATLQPPKLPSSKEQPMHKPARDTIHASEGRPLLSGETVVQAETTNASGDSDGQNHSPVQQQTPPALRKQRTKMIPLKKS